MRTCRLLVVLQEISRELLRPFARVPAAALVALIVLGLGASSAGAQLVPTSPSITSVRLEANNIVVTASVPTGLRRITLETRERLGGRTWEPRIVARVDGTGGSVTFRLERSRSAEMLRVRADVSDPLPATFYTGTNEFYEVSSGAASPIGVFPGQVDAQVQQNSPPANAPREVVESDIWKIRGQTLYFFNQLRGLQAIDLTNPDAPQLRGTLDLPAVGEDMYTLGDRHVVLLARNDCSGSESEVVVAIDNGGAPTITARLPVPGYIQESRLVGSALYVASSAYRMASEGAASTWEWGTQISSFDLADPNAPVARNTVWYSGYGNVVSATDRLLFVVTQDPANWWQSVLRVVDITSPDGVMHAYETVRTAGRIPDKFKINWENGILTTVSEDWRAVSGRRVTTMIETYRLPDPRSAGPAGVSKLGELEVGRGEQLHATRFDGRRLYVVTFFRIDPLFVIDLSNPSSPRLTGSVDVPGWSTYIRPMGDRLVTIGVESNRVAVSLFNVANPAAPVLSDRVRLGENFSWSEANYDEQAFSVLPEAGLILVPFSGDSTNGYTSRVQLIDLNDNSLTARGLIEHSFQPRRATLYSNRILSVSGWELLSVDATDRDHPSVRATLPLAWPVDRLFLQGEYLVELGGSSGAGWWGTTDQPVLRVARADRPNTILSDLALKPLPVLGATARAGKLYVAQGEVQPRWGFWPIIVDGDPNLPPVTPQKVALTVFDLSALPAVQKLGETEVSVGGSGLGSDLQVVWPKPDLLVFSGGGFSGWPCFVCAVPMAAMAADAQIFRPWPWWGGGGMGGHLVAFDVSQPTAPKLASEVDLAANEWWNFSQPFAANGLVYLSHQLSAFIEVPVILDPLAVVSPDGGFMGTWVTRSYLDVVDFNDPTQPLVRRAVNIPGRLNGVSPDGSLLYTVGTRSIGATTAWTEYLDASAYDGVSAHLVDTLALPSQWPHPLVVSGPSIFIGWPDYGTNAPTTAAHSIQTWSLSGAGKFVRSARVAVANPASSLLAVGGLLAAQQMDNSLTLFEVTNPAALRKVGEGRPSGCQWYDLTHADGQAGRGLWLPLGAYGVASLPAAP